MQNEVSQKEKKKYCVLTHIYEIQKDGTDEPICGVTMEILTFVDATRKGEGGMS